MFLRKHLMVCTVTILFETTTRAIVKTLGGNRCVAALCFADLIVLCHSAMHHHSLTLFYLSSGFFTTLTITIVQFIFIKKFPTSNTETSSFL